MVLQSLQGSDEIDMALIQQPHCHFDEYTVWDGDFPECQVSFLSLSVGVKGFCQSAQVFQ